MCLVSFFWFGIWRFFCFAFWRKGLAKDCWGLVAEPWCFTKFCSVCCSGCGGGEWRTTRDTLRPKPTDTTVNSSQILGTQKMVLQGHEHLLVKRASHRFLNSDLPTIIWDHLGSFFWSKSSPIPKRPLVRVPRSCWPPVKMIIHSIRSYFVLICSNFWKQLVRTIVGAIGAIWSNMEQYRAIWSNMEQYGATWMNQYLFVQTIRPMIWRFLWCGLCMSWRDVVQNTVVQRNSSADSSMKCDALSIKHHATQVRKRSWFPCRSLRNLHASILDKHLISLHLWFSDVGSIMTRDVFKVSRRVQT